MTPYPHPQTSLAVFQERLSQDLALANGSYSLQCGAPVPTNVGLANSACASWQGSYNTMVDMLATGSPQGEVDGYLYNRLDLAALQMPAYTFMPYVKGNRVNLVDLLPEINFRSGLNLQPEDIVNVQLPTCDCACSPIGITMEASQTSLLFIGQIPLYVWGEDVPLNQALTQIFLGTP